MSDAKKKVKAYMDEQIAVLEEGLDRLYAEDRQPAKEGNLYNGMLKCQVYQYFKAPPESRKPYTQEK